MLPDHPLRFRPILMPRLWGGHRLARLGRRPAAATPGPIGEAWLLSDRPEAASAVTNGPCRGRTIAQLRARFGTALLGRVAMSRGAGDRPFPLLVKVIDAAQTLSAQVHPPDSFACIHEPTRASTGWKARATEPPAGTGWKACATVPPEGKMEAWVVLQARSGAAVVRGFRPGTTRDRIVRCLHEQRLESVLRPVRVKAGDAVWVPPGTVHTIGAGICVAEFQQNSDITYRLYDWNRCDRLGRRRELHVDRALAVLRTVTSGSELIRPRALPAVGFDRERLVDCAKFRLERRQWRGTARFHTGGEAIVLFAARGTIEIVTGIGRPRSTRLRPWEAVLMPAAAGPFSARATRGATLLWATAKWG